MYQKILRIFNTVFWLLVIYFTYVFLRNVGISPYDLVDQVADIANFFLFSIGA